MIPIQLIWSYMTKLKSHVYYPDSDKVIVTFNSKDNEIYKIKEYYSGNVILKFNNNNELLYAEISKVHDLMTNPQIQKELHSVPPVLLKMVEDSFLK